MNTFSKVLLSVPVLLTSVVSPALANDSRTISTTTGKTYTVQRQHVKCVTNPWAKNIISGRTFRNFFCDSAGVMSDLVGNRYHYSETDKLCAFQYEGENWDWHENVVIKDKSLTCGIVRAFQ